MAEDDGDDTAQRIINGFVQQMVAGRQLPSMSPGSRSVTTMLVQLDKDLTTLFLGRSGASRKSLPLETVEEVAVGSEGAQGVEQLNLDDLCVTLSFDGEEAIAFRFRDVEERDTFALCLGMFADQRRAALDEEEEEEEEEDEEEEEEEEESAEEEASTADPSIERIHAGALRAAQETNSHRSEASNSARSSLRSNLSDEQQLMKDFVKKMVRGRALEMPTTAGSSMECIVSLDRDLTNLIIQRSERKDANKRVLPLGNIVRVASGDTITKDVELELQVDAQCVALMLKEGKVVAFRIEESQDRRAFAHCLGILAQGNRKAAKKR